MIKKLSPMEKKASSKVLDELRSHAQGMMKDKMAGLKKVTVASDSAEGLKKGLSKAEEILGAKKEGSEKLTKSPLGEKFGESEPKKLDEQHPEEIDGLSSEHEAEESDEFEAGEQEGMEECKTPEEVDAKIKELMALKQQMLAKK